MRILILIDMEGFTSYYLEDGTLFNLQIIKDGFANAYTKYPVIYIEEFLKAQQEARENKRGLWGEIDFEGME